MKNNLKLSSFLSGKNSMKIILAVGFLGILLIVSADFFTTPKVAETPKITDHTVVFEDKIRSVVTAITGEENPQVMVTLASKERYVYATENKEKDSQNTEERVEKEREEKYIIIKNASGAQEALLVTEIQPEIKGVVIVSQYAKNSSIRESIINAIKTVLDLSSNKVCVVSKSN